MVFILFITNFFFAFLFTQYILKALVLGKLVYFLYIYIGLITNIFESKRKLINQQISLKLNINFIEINKKLASKSNLTLNTTKIKTITQMLIISTLSTFVSLFQLANSKSQVNNHYA